MASLVHSPFQRRIRLRAGVALFILLFEMVVGARGQQAPPDFAVKAAYLLNFAKFVRWPAIPSPDFKICVYGADELEQSLRTLANGEAILGKPVEVVHLASLAGQQQCQILYIGSSHANRFSMTALHGDPVLVVGDADDFLRRGGMIQFQIIDDRVRFSANPGAARAVGVTLTADLLKVASHVEATK